MRDVRPVAQQVALDPVVFQHAEGLMKIGPVVQDVGEPGHGQQLAAVGLAVVEEHAFLGRLEAAGRQRLQPIAVVGVAGQRAFGHPLEGLLLPGDGRHESLRRDYRPRHRPRQIAAQALALLQPAIGQGGHGRLAREAARLRVQPAQFPEPPPTPGVAREVILLVLVGIGLGRAADQAEGQGLGGLLAQAASRRTR